MNQDKRHQGTEFDKHQDKSGKPGQDPRSTVTGANQQSGQQSRMPKPGEQPGSSHPGPQQGGPRDRSGSDSKSGGPDGQQR